ncbi:4-alpha-glucanotransferase [Shewanella aestuarii]|uniref:4-alpha-glucanotransferase n=1 Tax=Shewanella aestuarii TaxID=1028752 RepID=A0A6G9QLA9_9GAMM|nr:4-alpha-glucanotransferase [Shewanella aestuarii]QIR14649.1 4-alpha-glucanotransferase [Shewanella aestuarii]
MGLEKLLYLQGVGSEFIDCFGQLVHIPSKDRLGILTSMRASTSLIGLSEQQLCQLNDLQVHNQVNDAIYQLDVQPWLLPLHGFQWCLNRLPHIDVYLPEADPSQLAFEIFQENQFIDNFTATVAQANIVGEYYYDGIRYCQYRFAVANPLLMGYYQVKLTITFQRNFKVYRGTLMVSPDKTFSIDKDVQIKKRWGLNAQLYALRSDKQWGMGDFGDLADLIEFASGYGADFILLNPLHALDISQPDNPSPYSPTDRRRINPLYIHIESVTEYSAIQAQIESTPWLQKRALLNQSSLINYQDVQCVKYDIFALLYEIFCQKHVNTNSKRYQDFLTYIEKDKVALEQFVATEVRLASKYFNHEKNFYLYLQFIANEQFVQSQLTAKQCGMQLGLIGDLAVGAVSHGAEISQNEEVFCINASIGAPPDPFAEQGQNWGLAPLDPVKLKQQNFTHFIQLIRSNMQHCGALRIDHVMGLLRLWWWPANRQLGNGSYVYYPVETLIAIICLESHLARCVVIGEDLGIVPPEIVSSLENAGILSNELFYFTKQHEGFTSPQDYKSQCLMMLANHDVPTLKAWWLGDDLLLRRQLQLIDSEQKLTDLLTLRQNEKRQLVSLLGQYFEQYAQQSSLDEIEFEPLLLAWIALGASGESQLFSVQLSDLVADKHSVNIPGTWKEYPNWQQRLPITIGQMQISPQINQRLAVIAETRLHGLNQDLLACQPDNPSKNG